MIHMIESALIHGLIYRLLWGLFRSLGLGASVLLTLAAIMAMALLHRLLRPRWWRRRW